jgi:hypothetical protein
LIPGNELEATFHGAVERQRPTADNIAKAETGHKITTTSSVGLADIDVTLGTLEIGTSQSKVDLALAGINSAEVGIDSYTANLRGSTGSANETASNVLRNGLVIRNPNPSNSCKGVLATLIHPSSETLETKRGKKSAYVLGKTNDLALSSTIEEVVALLGIIRLANNADVLRKFIRRTSNNFPVGSLERGGVYNFARKRSTNATYLGNIRDQGLVVRPLQSE